jgi:arsenate reductase
MTKVTLYHNPRCAKSRAALALLEQEGIQPELRLYLETPPGKEELKTLLKQLGIPVRDMLRTSEEAYEELALGQNSLSDDEILTAIAAEPILLQRPIAVSGQHAIIGRPPELVLELL